MRIRARGTCRNCGQRIVRVYRTLDLWSHWITRDWKQCDKAEVSTAERKSNEVE